MNLILASGSPRRKELLSLLNLEFKVDTSVKVDEHYPEDMPAREVPVFLSRLKAEAHRPLLGEDDMVITADTVVILDGKVIGKPRDEQDAHRMLKRLSGRVHEVVTGVTLATRGSMETFSALSTVEFARLTDEEIDYYVTTFHPLDKAGAYGIQEWIGAAGIKSIQGSFYNVMGLPVHLLYQKLKTLSNHETV